MKTFKAEMIYTTNKNFNHRLGKIGDCYFEDGMVWMDDFHTSYVVNTSITNDVLTVNTRNSTYKFKILEGIENVPNVTLKTSEIEENENRINFAMNKMRELGIEFT